MKKKIDYQLSAEEKQRLKAKKISLTQLQEYAPDEIVMLLSADQQRSRELHALAEFQRIPSLGVGFASELIAQGYYSLSELLGKTGAEMYEAFEQFVGAWADPCVEDSYRLLAHYIEHGDDSKRWWSFTAERKAYRAQHGYPVDRPKKPWYELPEFNMDKSEKQREVRA